MKDIITELRNYEAFDLLLEEEVEEVEVGKQLDTIYCYIESIIKRQIITSDEVIKINNQVKNLLSNIEQKFLTPDYFDTLASVKAEQYSAWKENILKQPCIFSDLENSPGHQAELNSINLEYKRVEPLLNSNKESAKEILQKSIKDYERLKEYTYLEIPYQILVKFIGTVNNVIAYEAGLQGLLHAISSTSENKLQAHLRLAGLYKGLRVNEAELPSVTQKDLFTEESFHYSEAYKLTQGELDPQAHIVLQREMGVAYATTLGTYNIQQCVVVIAHDANPGSITHNKVALLHFDRYSGPRKFKKQLESEFLNASKDQKIDLYVTGARDRSSQQVIKVSDSNANQVLKQFYLDEKFNIKVVNLGDKLLPPAVVFDPLAPEGQRLLHRMPNRADSSLNSRSIVMNLNFVKGDYLYPLIRIDFSKSENERKILFSDAQLSQLLSRDTINIADSFMYSDMWKYNIIIEPELDFRRTLDTPVMENVDHFEKGLFQDLNKQTHGSVIVSQPLNQDIARLQQQRISQSTDLIEVLYNQNSLNPYLGNSNQAYPNEPLPVENHQSVNVFEAINAAKRVLDDSDSENELLNKKFCFNRRKRETGSEICVIDSEKLLRELEQLSTVEREELVEQHALQKVGGHKQKAVEKLFHNYKLNNHLQRVGKISSGLMQSLFAEEAFADLMKGDASSAVSFAGLMGLSHGLGQLSEWITKNTASKCLNLSTPFLRRGTSLLNAFDLAKQITAFRKGNKDALAGILGDSINIGIDLAEAGIEVAEISSEAIAMLGISSVTGPVGEVATAFVMLGVKIFDAVRSVAQLDQLVSLSGWEKFKEGWRAFLGISREEYIQKILDLTQEYERIFFEKSKVFAEYPEIKAIVFSAIKKISEACQVTFGKSDGPTGGRVSPSDTAKKTACDPIFAPVENSYVNFNRQENKFKLVREQPTPPIGSQLVCLPTGNYVTLREPAYRCDGAVGMMNSNANGSIALLDLGKGSDTIVGFPNAINFFMVKEGFKKYSGGKEDDLFFMQASQVEGDFDGKEGVDTLDISGFKGAVKVSLNNHMTYVQGNWTTSLGLKNIENLMDESIHYSGEKLVTATCATTNIILQEGIKQIPNKITIPQYGDCNYRMNLSFKTNTDVIQEAKQGAFNYNIQPGTGAVNVYFSVHTPPELSQHQFALNNSISDLVSWQHTITDIFTPERHHIQFHFLNHEIRHFLRTIQTIFIEKMDKSEVKIDYQGLAFDEDSRIESHLPKSLNKTQSQELLRKYFTKQNFNPNEFNITLNARHEIRQFTLELLKNTDIELEDFKLTINYFLINNTFFYFKRGEQLKLGDKNNYLFHKAEESVENIIHTYLPIANRLKLTCILHTVKNEVVIIGHDKHEVMQNDPRASVTHLLGNGGENMFIIDSGVTELPASPLNDVYLYHLENGNHRDTLDLRALNTQVRAKLSEDLKVNFERPTEQNGLGKDVLILLVLPSNSLYTNNQLMRICLKNGINWYYKLHVILNVAPQQIVDRNSHLHLQPNSLKFDSQHIAIVNEKDVEKNTTLIIPRTYKPGAFFHHNRTNLLWTNTLTNKSREIEPFTLILENFFLEPKLETLFLQFTDKKRSLRNKLSQINAAEDFEEAKNRQQAYLKEKSSAIINSKKNYLLHGVDTHLIQKEDLTNDTYEFSHGNSIEHEEDYSEESNAINWQPRDRRSIMEENTVNSAAARSSGVIQSIVNSLNGFWRTTFNSQTTLELNAQDHPKAANLNFPPISYEGSFQGNVCFGTWVASFFAPSIAKRTQKMGRVSSSQAENTELEWSHEHLQDGIKMYGGG